MTASSSEDFSGRVALVTGGGSGIGRASAQAFAARRASVVVADVDSDGVARTVGLVEESGGTGHGVAADVTSPQSVEAMVAETLDRFGRLDAALNSAGTSGVYAPTAEQSIEDWDATIALNLTGVFLSMRAEIPALLSSGGGSIVNMSSVAGVVGTAGLPAYVASKHGVVGLTKAAALEYARSGLRVNCICPGSVRTPMLEAFVGDDEKMWRRVAGSYPIGRIAEPEEIAGAVVWMCSSEASFLVGHALVLDGGASAQ